MRAIARLFLCFDVGMSTTDISRIAASTPSAVLSAFTGDKNFKVTMLDCIYLEMAGITFLRDGLKPSSFDQIAFSFCILAREEFRKHVDGGDVAAWVKSEADNVSYFEFRKHDALLGNAIKEAFAALDTSSPGKKQEAPSSAGAVDGGSASSV